MGEITIASTSDTPNQVREALGLPAVADTPDPGQNPFEASAEVAKAPPEKAEAAPVTETPPAAPPPPPAEDDDDEEDDDEVDPAASEAGRVLGKAGRSAKGRIQRMRYEQAELKNKLSAKDAETSELRARLEALESGRLTPNPNGAPPATPPPAAEPPAATFTEARPKSDDFTDYDEYELAKEEWLVKKVNFERDQKEAAADARRAAAAEDARRQAAIDAGVREAQAKWEERRAKAKERFPDFDEVFENSKDLQIAQPAIVAIQHSDLGAELTYYLATHPEEVARINKLPPGGIWTEMGKLEVKLELGLIGGATDAPAREAAPVVAAPVTAAGRVPVSSAPAPVTRVGAGGSVASTSKDPDKMSHAEFKAWRAAGGGQ